MFSRLRELEQIRISNHEAVEEREMQSLFSLESKLNPLETSWMESEVSEGGGSIPAGRRRWRRGKARTESWETSTPVFSAAPATNGTVACISSSQDHDDHASGRREATIKVRQQQTRHETEDAQQTALEKAYDTQHAMQADAVNGRQNGKGRKRSSSGSSGDWSNDGEWIDGGEVPSVPLSSSGLATSRARRTGASATDVCGASETKSMAPRDNASNTDGEKSLLCSPASGVSATDIFASSMRGDREDAVVAAGGEQGEAESAVAHPDTPRPSSPLFPIHLKPRPQSHKKTPGSAALPRRHNNLVAWVRSTSRRRCEEAMMQFIGGNVAFLSQGSGGGVQAPAPVAKNDDGSVHRRRRKVVVMSSPGKAENASLRHGRGTNDDAGRNTTTTGGGGGGDGDSTGVAIACTKMVATAKAGAAGAAISPTRAVSASFGRRSCTEAPCHTSTPAQHVTPSRTLASASLTLSSPAASQAAMQQPLPQPSPLRVAAAAAALSGLHPHKHFHTEHSAVMGVSAERRTPENLSPTRGTKPNLTLTAAATTTAVTTAKKARTAAGTSPTTCASRFSRHSHSHVGINSGMLAQQHCLLYLHNFGQDILLQPTSNLHSGMLPLEKWRFREGGRMVSGGSDASEEQECVQCVAHGTSGLNAPLLSCGTSLSTNEPSTPPSQRQRLRRGRRETTEASPTGIAARWKQRRANTGARPSSNHAKRALDHTTTCVPGAGRCDVPEFVELCSTFKGVESLRAAHTPEKASPPTVSTAANQQRPRVTKFVVAACGTESVAFASTVALQSSMPGAASTTHFPRALKRVKRTPAFSCGGNQHRTETVTPTATRVFWRPAGGGC
ncbi:hypothetical protein TraAM80_05258 [Trypanosoma rangeli]|uniref:Uncharacterized protein n=1 Tax=Trypanosoma rangeli TaxID=5698 RepID=A0A422NG18_TRYRA|nr:uncharacterized protein TraAM80_05258 [Trypanosoma rangeli]RNF04379.1 hypothetical protein TraAM80_05258 [Trypanosoma rangeli]|eukprot:RNF04379.1 hypothetical protein TraAM80_05258 [Trypanosoma rangeli]